MTNDRDDFAEWRDGIESRVSTVETQAEVRAGMDRDMSDLGIKYGAQKQLLEALRETQSEHTATLRNHTDILRDHTERLERLEVGQATVLVGVQTIIGLLDRDIDAGGESGDGNPGSPG